jgi:uncharacterized membrane protein
MMVDIVLSGLAGYIVGIRFRVLAIVPVVLVFVAIAVVLSIKQGDAVFSTVVFAVLSAIIAELGYLCGAFTPIVARKARAIISANSNSAPSQSRPRNVNSFD